MNLALYIAAKQGDVDGFIDALNASLSVIYNQMTPLKNTVHVAAIFANERFSCPPFRSLLSRRNRRGETALHMAAISGHLGIVEVLVRFQIDQMRKNSLLDVYVERNNGTLIGKFEERVVANEDGNTPLREALKNNHEKAAEENMEAMTSYRQRLTWMALKSAGAERKKLQKKLRSEKLNNSRPDEGEATLLNKPPFAVFVNRDL
ncbi:hypothetical protein POM88_037881 [Heracleum sosnowskyi]|uniref:Ankyrin repeat-containing protein n=1 Tax=Heracleum sosnowskyi TaxID=360622 RepID=A0AAD8HSB0_9APIA|nr:hypothetical protein POM88_037881 [Heracleum sosnowskyi]